jgi:hypothetical protein
MVVEGHFPRILEDLVFVPGKQRRADAGVLPHDGPFVVGEGAGLQQTESGIPILPTSWSRLAW